MTTDKEQTVPCQLCANDTAMLGTELCDRCWELKRRIEADPELTQKILDLRLAEFLRLKDEDLVLTGTGVPPGEAI